MIVTYDQLIKAAEEDQINGNQRESYRQELYRRYTGKDPHKTVFNGIKVTHPDGSVIYYTIHYRTDNTRPYAVYINGSQTAHNTYVYRWYAEKIIKRIRYDLSVFRDGWKIEDLFGEEIIT